MDNPAASEMNSPNKGPSPRWRFVEALIPLSLFLAACGSAAMGHSSKAIAVSAGLFALALLCARFRFCRRLVAIVAANWLILELLLQFANVFHPLFRPARLVDTFENEWLEGHDWFDGESRLYIYKPKAGASTYGHPFHVNRWGFRGKDFQDREREGWQTFRIMVLGDSMTAGVGVAEESRFTDVLERELQERYPSNKIEVINLGVQGFETVQEQKILKRMWPIVQPDLVIVGFFENDPNLHYVSSRPHKLPVDGRMRTVAEHWLSFRILETLYGFAVVRLRHLPSAEDELAQAYRPDSRDWHLFEQSVQEIGEFVHAQGRGQPLVIGLMDTQRAKARARYWPVRRVFERAGFAWVDWEGEGPYEPVSRFEGHPNERTHVRYAHALAAQIGKSGVIPAWQGSSHAPPETPKRPTATSDPNLRNSGSARGG